MKRKGSPSLSLCAAKRVVDALDWEERMQLLEYAHAAHKRWFVESMQTKLKKTMHAKYHAQVDAIEDIWGEADESYSSKKIFVSTRNGEAFYLASSIAVFFFSGDEFYNAMHTQYDMLVEEYFACFKYTKV